MLTTPYLCDQPDPGNGNAHGNGRACATVEQVGISKCCPFVIEISFAERDADTAPACVSVDGKAVREPPPFSSFILAACSKSREFKPEAKIRHRDFVDQQRSIVVTKPLLTHESVH
jgi:hypothetical protein